MDCLGRTRTCLRKDLSYLKSKDKDLKLIVDEKKRSGKRSPSPPPRTPTPPPESLGELTEDNELLSSDMRREMLRRQWEKEEEELRDKSNIHYQDILFNGSFIFFYLCFLIFNISEARTHGVGYYGFSKDEEERAKQQEALRKLRQETEQQQKKSQNLKSMREKQLAARVKAARNRKRARMGLPPEEENGELATLYNLTTKFQYIGNTDSGVITSLFFLTEPEPVAEPAEKEPQIDEAIAEKEKVLSELRKKHVRPWDKGKEGVRKEHYEYSQEEWVDKKRKERPDEFAPPSAYRREYRSTTVHQVEDTDKSLRFSSKKTSEKSKNPYKQNVVHHPVPIMNELSSDEDQDALLSDYKVISETNDLSRGKRAEIAPPATYDYYGPTSSKKNRKGPEGGNVSDSIEAGLKFLRQQLEKKESNRRSEDMFLS